MVVLVCLKSVIGFWENLFYNFIVYIYSVMDSWWFKGYGMLIDDVNGNWWIVYYVYVNGYYILGCFILIELIEWMEDGWYCIVFVVIFVILEQEIKYGLELFDDFKGF